jgi:hypothetical protein
MIKFFLLFAAVLQPVPNQYNITEKIKEANQLLYKNEQQQRSSQPKVRFRDHQLVDYEPEEDDESSCQMMETKTTSVVSSSNQIHLVTETQKKDEESSDDGYIDDEVIEITTDVETIEIEDVCEQIEVLELLPENKKPNLSSASTLMASSNLKAASNDKIEETNYERDEFHDDNNSLASSMSVRPASSSRMMQLQPSISSNNLHMNDDDSYDSDVKSKKHFSTKKIFYSKINPMDDAEATLRKHSRKQCCQYKETDEYKQKLPKYNGLYSNYGLSKDEILRRELKQLENIELKQQWIHKRVKQKEHMAKNNEAAFAKWWVHIKLN